MTTEVPTWRASVKSSGTSVSGDLMLTGSLNDYAQASASLYPGDTSGAAQAPISAMATIMGAAQRRALLQSEEAFTASITAGGDTVEFAGYEMQPGCQAAVGGFQPRLGAVHRTSIMSRLQMSLYSSNLNTPLDSVTTTNIPARILEIVQKLVRDWIKFGFPTLTPKDKELASQIHEANTIPLQTLERILTGSPDFEVPELSGLLRLSPAWHHAFNQWIANSLIVGVGDFFPALLQLLEQLGMNYVPAFGGPEVGGKVIGLRDALITADDKSIGTAQVLSMAPVAPSNQIARVVIEKIPTTGLFRGSQDQETSILPGQASPTSIVYPKGNRIGRSLVMLPPAFLSPVFANMRGGSSGFTLQPGQVDARIAELTVRTAAMTDALKAYLTAVAKNVYAMSALQGSRVSCTMPLDVSWQLGTNYRVSDRGSWFTGLLAQVTHSVSSNAASAQTTLQFSHVQWNGFSISSLLT